MKALSRSILCSVGSFALAFCVGYAVFADPVQLKGYMTVIPLKGQPSNTALAVSAGGPSLPLWNYTATASAALGGGTYTGTMVGRSPFDNGKTTTTITTQIIPLIITINDGTTTVTYDPTITDPCVTPGSFTGVSVITGSPIFTNNNWTMNGISMGNTQYIDAFQRAEFWSQVAGTPYHVILNPTVLPAQTLSITTGNRMNYSNQGTCHTNVGVMDINTMDLVFQNLITGPLAASVNPGTFPIFLTRNVVMSDGAVANCCILGYHGAFTGTGGNLQIYSPFSLDSAGVFGAGFVSTLSHEMGEAINDPTGNNLTPTWGNIGQQSAGQNNLETGDPLSPGGIAPTSAQFTVVGANGLTYQLQEMAFYSWFFGGTSLGAGGKYSNHGTLSGSAKLYPPGGTN